MTETDPDVTAFLTLRSSKEHVFRRNQKKGMSGSGVEPEVHSSTRGPSAEPAGPACGKGGAAPILLAAGLLTYVSICYRSGGLQVTHDSLMTAGKIILQQNCKFLAIGVRVHWLLRSCLHAGGGHVAVRPHEDRPVDKEQPGPCPA